MKRVAIVFYILVFCLLSTTVSFAEEETVDQEISQPVQDQLLEAHRSVLIEGQEIDYTVTAGTIAMDTELGQYEMFFTAYTKDGVEDLSERPITFAFNGGPGSASLWINFGLLGPRRIDVDDDGMVKQVPSELVDNENSLLDITDLVFIDPVGTGFSRAAGDTDASVFYNYTNDIASVGDFIRIYTTRYHRWSSPKYVAGESYGTTRAVGLCQYLDQTYAMNLNGLLLISTANDYGTIEFGKNQDIPFVTYLPTYAATAWYHHKLDETYQSMDLEAYLEEVREFAANEYQAALLRGSKLTAEELDKIAGQLSSYIGLSKDLILQQNLRITMDSFVQELFRDEKLLVGRLDSRYTGPVVSGSAEDGQSDPSAIGILEAFTGAVMDYYTADLGYQTDEPYQQLSVKVNEVWAYTETTNSIIAQENTIYEDMSRNKFLKVWVVCGYYDLATPFFAAEYVYDHVFLDDDLQDNLSFTYYPSGHMFYMHKPSLEQFREDAKAWYLN